MDGWTDGQTHGHHLSNLLHSNPIHFISSGIRHIFLHSNLFHFFLFISPGIGHLLFFHLPFCLHLGRSLESRFKTLVRKRRPSSSSSPPSSPPLRFLRSFLRFLLSHWFSLLFFPYHFYFTFLRAQPYGFWQLALAPVKTWFFFVAAALIWRAKTAPVSAYRKTALKFGLIDDDDDGVRRATPAETAMDSTPAKCDE